MAADLENDPLGDDSIDNITESTNDEELEQYGVWVKVGPEDVEDNGIDDEFELASLSPDEMSGEAMLTEEEEQLLGDLEEEEPADELGDLSEMTLDEFTDGSDFSTEEAGSIDDAASDELGNLSDIELDEGSTEIDLDADLTELDNELESLDLPVAGDIDVPDIDVLDIDDTVDMLAGADEDMASIELDNLDDMNVEEDLAEPETEDDEQDFTADLGLDDLDSSLEVDLETLNISEEPAEIAADRGSEAPDDLASLEMDLQEDLEADVSADGFAPTPTASAPDLSKIEAELRSIKNEIKALKNELSSLKSAPQFSGEPSAEPKTEEAGFFAEDDDETIALTNDELDNILNTADITEETVEETESPDDQDFLDLTDTQFEEPEPEPVPEMADTELLVDRDDVISMGEEEVGSGEDFSLDEIDLEEPEVDAAAQTETINLDETDELLGEILPSDEDLLDIDDSDEVVLAEVTPSEKNEEADIEVESFEDLELDTLEEESLELEEISEEPDLEPVEELELDIEGGIPDIEEGAVELSEVGLDDAEDEIVSELSGVDIGGMTEELIQEVDLEELGEDLEELDEDLEELGQDLSEELGADLEALDETEDLPSVSSASSGPGNIPESLKLELKSVLGYMDHLLESLPEEKIQEFAQSEHFEVYKKLFEELGLES